MLRYCSEAAVVSWWLVVDGQTPTTKNQQPPTKTLRWLLRRGSPLPIPNREVKPACADGTAICGRVCRRLSLVSLVWKDKAHFLYLKPTGLPPLNLKCPFGLRLGSLEPQSKNRPGFFFYANFKCKFNSNNNSNRDLFCVRDSSGNPTLLGVDCNE